MKRLAFILLSIICFVAGAKADYTVVDVESWGNFDMNGHTFAIASMYDDVDETDPEYQQYAQYVASVLVFNGAVWQQDPNAVEVMVMLGYGINSAAPRAYNAVSWSGSSISISTITATENHARYINLQGYTKENGVAKMAWKTQIKSEGSAGNLSIVFPVMLYAARNYLGHPIGPTRVKETDDSLTAAFSDMFTENYDTFVYWLIRRGDLINRKAFFSRNIAVSGASEKVRKNNISISFAILNEDCLTLYIHTPWSSLRMHKSAYLDISGHRYESPICSREMFEGKSYCLIHFSIPQGDTPSVFPLVFKVGDKQNERKTIAWETIVAE